MATANEIPIYVQLISGTILGVALGNILSGAAKFVQQPQTHKINILHGLWIAFIVGSIMVFWWQEGLTFQNVQWTFPLYMFQVAYCATYLFMVAVLLPENVQAYDSHYGYFIARRHWFYGSLILSYLLSMANSVVKEGWDGTLVDPTFIVMNVILVGMLIAASVLNRRWLHIAVAVTFVLLTIGSMLVE